MDVTLKHDASGVPYVRLWWRNSATGKVERPYRSFAGMSDEDAQAAAEDWACRFARAAEMRTSLRVPDVLRRYIDAQEARGLAANTCKAYRSDLKNHVEPYLGAADMDQVRPYAVDELYEELLEHGGQDGAGLSANTVRRVHWFLTGAFAWAVSAGLCREDPMPYVHAPAAGKYEPSVVSGGELLALSARLLEELRVVSGDAGAVFRRSAALAAWLSLSTGCRCGEACALRWRDVEGWRIARICGTVVEDARGVRRQAHTKSRVPRNVTLGGTDAEVLRAAREWQRVVLPAPVRADGPVCCGADGGFLRPSSVSAWFGRLRRELGLPDGVTFHSLRHTHASVLLADGVDLRTLQERLGHAKASTTLELYAHLLPGRDAAAAAAFEGAVLGRGG